MPERQDDVTGLILAGGLGRRLGGADKGLQLHVGRPLAAHVLGRLAPQVGATLFNANRHLDVYEALGARAVSDTLPGHLGPLAGMLAGLLACRTPFLATVPCDAPLLPLDLVARLRAALDASPADAAVAAVAARGDGEATRLQPTFSLLHVGLVDALNRFLLGGNRKAGAWFEAIGAVVVPFDDARAFVNVNTPDDLARLER